MTTVEKVYTAIVILCAGFVLLGLASFHFVVIPGASEPDVFYFVVAVCWLIFVSLDDDLAGTGTEEYIRRQTGFE